MTENKSLPIEEMTQEEFQNFRLKYLELGEQEKRLSSEAITKIRQAYALQNFYTQRIPCNKDHAHKLDCVSYDFRSACIVDRLIEEIRGYRLYLNKIANELSGAR